MNKKSNLLPDIGPDKTLPAPYLIGHGQVGDYADGLNRLYNDIFHSKEIESPPREIGDEMLSLVVSDALNGIDIAKRYPTFYSNILSDAELMEAFINALEVEAISEDFQASAPVTLEFLQNLSSHSSVEIKSKDSWTVHWKRTIQQLQMIFSPAELAYRSESIFYDDPWFTLLRDEFEIDGESVSVVLDGTLNENEDDSMEVSLKVAFIDSSSNEEIFPNLKSTLHWGEYLGETQISSGKGGMFPPISISSIMDENLEEVSADLRLELKKESA